MNAGIPLCEGLKLQAGNSAARQLFVYTRNTSRKCYVNTTQSGRGGCQIRLPLQLNMVQVYLGRQNLCCIPPGPHLLKHKNLFSTESCQALSVSRKFIQFDFLHLQFLFPTNCLNFDSRKIFHNKMNFTTLCVVYTARFCLVTVTLLV